MIESSFAVLITTHGRPDNVRTYDTLRKFGYTGRIILVVDDLDPTLPQYISRYGDEVVVFDKQKRAEVTDKADNLPDLRAVVFARNECFDIAKERGIEVFLQVDDDYEYFMYRFNEALDYVPSVTKTRALDNIFTAFIRFMRTTPTHCIAMAQGGDFIGGNTDGRQKIRASRKVMNTFFLSTEKRFEFFARMNDDVTTYTYGGSIGQIFITTNQISIGQPQTQTVDGGMSELYRELGTYVKSFYSILYHPSSIKVRILKDKVGQRLHHSIAWRYTVPKILREEHQKRASA